jgi:hypothetical protein
MDDVDVLALLAAKPRCPRRLGVVAKNMATRGTVDRLHAGIVILVSAGHDQLGEVLSPAADAHALLVGETVLAVEPCVVGDKSFLTKAETTQRTRLLWLHP